MPPHGVALDANGLVELCLVVFQTIFNAMSKTYFLKPVYFKHATIEIEIKHACLFINSIQHL